jgi:hypothetical protein
MVYFTKWAEVHAIPNKEASTVADALVTNFCRFGVPRELHSDQGRNFESRLMQEVSERLGTCKTRTTPLHPQSAGMVGRYVKTAEEQLRKVVSTHRGDWNERLPIFMLADRTSTHETARLHGVREGATSALVTNCSGVPPTRSSLRQTTWWTS